MYNMYRLIKSKQNKNYMKNQACFIYLLITEQSVILYLYDSLHVTFLST